MDKATQSFNPEVWGGIECTINRVQDWFFDQLHYSGHYGRSADIDLFAGLGIKKLRFPILWEKHQPSPDAAIDWNWTGQRLQALQQHGIEVIAGLVHHGSGPAFTHLLEERFPELLAGYARKVAEQFPGIHYYNPVNEPLTTARFSGLYGFWYPHKTDDQSFVRMLINEVKGVVLAMQEIRKVNPAARLVQTEDLAKTYSTEKLKYQAEFENHRRWLTYDLLSGRVGREHPLWGFLTDNVGEKELYFFLENPCPPDIFGFNYYITSERFLDERCHLYPDFPVGGNHFHRYCDVEAVRVEIEEETGIEVLLQEAWQRYQKPMAVTEVHLHCHREEQLRWFSYVWNACTALTAKGVDIRGVTAWALLGSYGWDQLLQQPGGLYEPGVFDLRGGVPRPTALAHFIRQLTQTRTSFHPVAIGNGWWRRSSRFFHRPEIRSKKQESVLPANARPVLVIGKTGTLGRAFARICTDRCIPVVLLGRAECDIANAVAVDAAIETFQPWAIVNAAGYVRVDDAEREVEQCFRENMSGPVNLARACQKKGVKLVTFSSDLVFDGKKQSPYVESDPVAPLNVYGKSKALCEEAVLQNNPSALVVRTSAFFGPWDQYNFLQSVIKQLTEQQVFTAASDIYVSPTYVPDLVHATLDLLIDDERGIWHLANRGAISWAELAYETASALGLDTKLINAVPLSGDPLMAPRPQYSVLSSEKATLLPALSHALQRFFEEKRASMPVVN